MTSRQRVPFRFQLSDRTLFKVERWLEVQGFGIHEGLEGGRVDLPALDADCAGVMLRSFASSGQGAGVSTISLQGRRWIQYVQQCFPRYYIDMSQTFDDYRGKFSAKTRSTLARKVRRFAEASGGQIRWERFATPSEIERFWSVARQLSTKTYQERLLDAGLPDSREYLEHVVQLAQRDSVRAFLLYDGPRPVSYLFCPIHDDTVQYAFLGYDPEYQRHSVGTVLQWLALESLFAEGRFRLFDFTEGESEHKRLFSTGKVDAVNLVLLRPTLGNRLLAHAHHGFARLIESIGERLEAHGLKAKARRWLRFGNEAT